MGKLNQIIRTKEGLEHRFSQFCYENRPAFLYEILFKNGKSVSPIRKLKDGEFLVFFDIVWSNDTSLMSATYFGGDSNQFKDYCYRIQFKKPTNGNFQYSYIVKPHFQVLSEFKNYIF